MGLYGDTPSHASVINRTPREKKDGEFRRSLECSYGTGRHTVPPQQHSSLLTSVFSPWYKKKISSSLFSSTPCCPLPALFLSFSVGNCVPSPSFPWCPFLGPASPFNFLAKSLAISLAYLRPHLSRRPPRLCLLHLPGGSERGVRTVPSRRLHPMPQTSRNRPSFLSGRTGRPTSNGGQLFVRETVLLFLCVFVLSSPLPFFPRCLLPPLCLSLFLLFFLNLFSFFKNVHSPPDRPVSSWSSKEADSPEEAPRRQGRRRERRTDAFLYVLHTPPSG